MRLVVDMVGDPLDGRLAKSQFVEKPFAFGGEIVCSGLAFAAAELDRDVELRGWIHEPTFRRFERATRRAPHVELQARAPEPGDLVVVPEGWGDPLAYLQLSLSPARSAIYVLAAPGLFGWPFAGGDWARPDPLTVEIGDLARPEHFRGMHALGFELLTHSEGIARAAAKAGVDCHFTGVGEPWRISPPAGERSVDVLALMSNRWAALARRVLDELSGLNVDRVPEVPNEEMLHRMSRAKVLVWPSRVEGHATIPVEARAMGCVPVALDTNPFGAALDDAHGVVTVGDVREMAPAVRALLDDASRLQALSERGRAAARDLTDWSVFVDRVRSFLDAPAPPDPGRDARAGAGAALRAAIQRERDAHQARLEERLVQVEVARQELTKATERQRRLLEEIGQRTAEVERLRRIPIVRAVERARSLQARLRGDG
jgi:glycosyl transferase family 1